jgi:hypothetical protein
MKEQKNYNIDTSLKIPESQELKEINRHNSDTSLPSIFNYRGDHLKKVLLDNNLKTALISKKILSGKIEGTMLQLTF